MRAKRRRKEPIGFEEAEADADEGQGKIQAEKMPIRERLAAPAKVEADVQRLLAAEKGRHVDAEEEQVVNSD